MLRLQVMALSAALLSCALSAAPLAAAITGPYTADANTLALYHFDETPGAANPGNPIINYGTVGTALNLTDTGGPNGRDNTGAGGYGAAAYAGFGTSFNNLNTGTGTYHTSANAQGAGIRTGSAAAQTNLQGANGAFTYEAMIQLPAITAEQQILAHDGLTNRGFLFRVIGGALSFYDGVNGTNFNATIPTSGAHAFVANEWFHVAITYNGNEGTAGNLQMYWSRVTESTESANPLTFATFPTNPWLAADLLSTSGSNPFGVGTTTRDPFRFELTGQVDEIRISNVARGANEFIFAANAVPEPSTLVVAGISGLVALGWARRRRS